MRESDFVGTIAGTVKWVYNRRYCYFRANTLPFPLKSSNRLKRRLRSTLMSLCRMDGMLSQLSDRDNEIVSNVFLLREAVASSGLDSSSPTMDEMYRSRKVSSSVKVDRSTDDVEGYIRASMIGYANASRNRKVTSFTLLDMHRELMRAAYGSGEFRVEQSMVGNPGDTLETARFVPVDPSSLPLLVENLMKYINTSVDEPLMKAALAHYQFEALMPFRDGNGRMGRMLAALMLYTEGITTSPMCFSEYLAEHRETYLNNLFDVCSADDFDDWFYFFLDAMGYQAERTLRRMRSICSLREDMLSEESNENRRAVVDMLFDNPYISVSDVMDRTGTTRPGALKMISVMEKNGVLEEVSGKQRGKLYLSRRIRDVFCE